MSAVAIYGGTAPHARRDPVRRVFAPRSFLAYADVDTLPHALDRLPAWSGRRHAPVRFRPEDFLTGDPRPLGEGIRDLVRARLGRRPDGPVYLLAQLRTWGYVFNPLTVYYCWEGSGQVLDAVVLEVTNTPWRERTWYVFDARCAGAADPRAAGKSMYVSPFLPMGGTYLMRTPLPGDNLSVSIALRQGGQTPFVATLTGHGRPITTRSAVSALLRWPLLTLRTAALIRWQGIRLWLRKVPVQPRPADATADERGR